ncbi:hypothetical protein QTO34_017716 [Cnephaeus nilssonii]|uniref:Uncharacterized protein n=1 Tax=Cnephaeus nilssonii TaxID=3371016 RepID=A0AA40LRG9_CNENI|nr:hypothetical protein QTO34_017716 [Eptesicus nilssonii]
MEEAKLSAHPGRPWTPLKATKSQTLHIPSVENGTKLATRILDKLTDIQQSNISQEAQCTNSCILKGTVGHKAAVGTGAGLRPILRTPTRPLLLRPPVPSLPAALFPLPPLAPADSVEQMGPAPAAGVSGGCCSDRPSGAGGGGEALRGDQGRQPPLTPADGTKRLGPVPDASSSPGALRGRRRPNDQGKATPHHTSAAATAGSTSLSWPWLPEPRAALDSSGAEGPGGLRRQACGAVPSLPPRRAEGTGHRHLVAVDAAIFEGMAIMRGSW